MITTLEALSKAVAVISKTNSWFRSTLGGYFFVIRTRSVLIVTTFAHSSGAGVHTGAHTGAGAHTGSTAHGAHGVGAGWQGAQKLPEWLGAWP